MGAADEAARGRRRLWIVTGASRGMGAAIVDQLATGPDNHVLCMARGRRADLPGGADLGADLVADPGATVGAGCEQWSVDLAEPLAVAERLERWLASLDAAAYADATLINNAAALTRIGPVDGCSDAELSSALRVGLEAPLLLSTAFLRGTRDWRAARRILNVSSGLGRRAMAGQASYCAVKAGLDHLSRAMALDEAPRPNGAKIVSLAPGVIDTDMQAALRAGDAAGFPERSMFVSLKENGQLTSPRDAAARLLAYLDRPDFGSNPVADVREA